MQCSICTQGLTFRCFPGILCSKCKEIEVNSCPQCFNEEILPEKCYLCSAMIRIEGDKQAKSYLDARISKMTCRCGKFVVQRIVKKLGQNHGKYFVCCSKKYTDKTKCNYFNFI